MDYELARQLRDGGFPQKEFQFHNGMTGKWPGDIRPADFPYNPTLSELIEACAEDFDLLCHDVRGVLDPMYSRGFHRSSRHWSASSWTRKTELGDTPEEAVARLYLALHANGGTTT